VPPALPVTRISPWTGGSQQEAVSKAQAELKPIIERTDSAICLILGQGTDIDKVVACVGEAGSTYKAVVAAAWIPDLRVLETQQLANWRPNGSVVVCFLSRTRRVHAYLTVAEAQDYNGMVIKMTESVGAP